MEQKNICKTNNKQAEDKPDGEIIEIINETLYIWKNWKQDRTWYTLSKKLNGSGMWQRILLTPNEYQKLRGL